MSNEEFVPMKKNGKSGEPLARKTLKERKIRHRSRTEKLKARPVVREGRLLDDEREWLDW